MAIGALLAGASGVLSGAGGLGGLAGGGGGETSSATVTQTFSTGPMTSGGLDQNTLLLIGLIALAALLLWPRKGR